MLFRGHGVAVVGQNLEEACTTAFALEKNAEIQLYANILGGFDPIKPEELAGHKSSSAYSYYLKKYGGQDR
jgi:ribulose-5-phosphate 4-epimerase/fuculose-1-phosphate aldolase